MEFDTMHDLLSHQREHVAEGWILDRRPICRPVSAFSCYHCEFRCEAKVHIRSHMTKHTRASKTHPYECGTCGFRAHALENLESHKLIHTNYRPFECHHCSFRAKNKHTLKKHIETIHLGLKPFACSKCNYRGTRKDNLVDHMRRNHGGRMYKCFQCNFQAPRQTGVHLHEMVHSGVKRFVCQECDYSTNFKSDLRNHMSIHTGWKPYQCSLCDYKCCNCKYLRIHMRVHTGEKPFECALCHRRYSHRSTLRKHMDGHYRVYRYKCSFCPYKTQYQTSIRYHEKLHEGDRPHGCPHCHKRFIDLYSLNVHIRVHTGEKPYSCDVCKSSFTYRNIWRQHLRECDPGNPVLRNHRYFVEPLPKKEATKAIIAAVAAAKPRSHERTILDFINRNQVKSDTDGSYRRIKEAQLKSDLDQDTESVTFIETVPELPLIISSESDISESESPDPPRRGNRSADCMSDGDHVMSDPDLDTERVTFIETGPESQYTISSESDTMESPAPFSTEETTKTSHSQTLASIELQKPPKATMSTSPNQPTMVSRANHQNQHFPETSSTDHELEPRERVIRKTTKSASFEFTIESDDVPSESAIPPPKVTQGTANCSYTFFDEDNEIGEYGMTDHDNSDSNQ